MGSPTVTGPHGGSRFTFSNSEAKNPSPAGHLLTLLAFKAPNSANANDEPDQWWPTQMAGTIVGPRPPRLVEATLTKIRSLKITAGHLLFRTFVRCVAVRSSAYTLKGSRLPLGSSLHPERSSAAVFRVPICPFRMFAAFPAAPCAQLSPTGASVGVHSTIGKHAEASPFSCRIDGSRCVP